MEAIISLILIIGIFGFPFILIVILDYKLNKLRILKDISYEDEDQDDKKSNN